MLRERLATDLLEVDYHEFAAQPVAVVCAQLGLDPKSPRSIEVGSPGAFDLAGMSRIQQEHAASLGSSS